jgi:hypothetical protein
MTTPEVALPQRGTFRAKLPRWRVLLLVGGGLLAALTLAVALAGLLNPSFPSVPCQPDAPCGDPPVGEPLINGETWTSTGLGYSFQYDAGWWSIDDEDARHVQLKLRTKLDARLLVEGAPASEASPQSLFSHRLGVVKSNYLGVTQDTVAAHLIKGPAVATRNGIGRTYVGKVGLPQAGVSESVQVAIMASGEDTTSLAVSVIVVGSDEKQRRAVMSLADSVLNTLQLRSDRAGG